MESTETACGDGTWYWSKSEGAAVAKDDEVGTVYMLGDCPVTASIAGNLHYLVANAAQVQMDQPVCTITSLPPAPIATITAPVEVEAQAGATG